MTLTNELRKRVISAIAETEELLTNELRYSPEHQKQDRLAFYRKHLAKLHGMLDGEIDLEPVWTAESARRRIGGTFGS